MSHSTFEDTKNIILDHEEKTAHQLARRVLEKPIPPVWMILIPVFFVFHAWRIKQYSRGLKDFEKNYLILRRKVLDAVANNLQNGDKLDLDRLVEEPGDVPPHALPFYHDLVSLITGHYQALIVRQGDSYRALIRSHYRSKANYLLHNNRLNKAESAFNRALLPDIEGDEADLSYVIEKMEQGVAELRRKEADQIFS